MIVFYKPNQPSTVLEFSFIHCLETSYAIQDTSSPVIWKLLKNSTIAGDCFSKEVAHPIWICFSASLEATKDFLYQSGSAFGCIILYLAGSCFGSSSITTSAIPQIA